MSAVTIKELLEAGVHFGHQTNRWNPKMKSYIYGGRNGIYIIDLQQTLKLFEDAAAFHPRRGGARATRSSSSARRSRRRKPSRKPQRCGMYYVNQRWLGGMLTNFQTISKSISRLRSWRR